jgi:hypothetical protein
MITKTLLDKLVANHNGQEDQEWKTTLAVKRRKGITEVIGICTYGNLYFVQLTKNGKARIDWIEKNLIGDHNNVDQPRHYRVNDSVLDKFRQETIEWTL